MVVISQVDEPRISWAEQQLASRQIRGSGVALALAERLHLSEESWSPALWASIERVRQKAEPAATAAIAFTPNSGRGRRVVTHLLETAAEASASAVHLSKPAHQPLASWTLPLVRDALTNAAPRVFGCWVEEEPPPGAPVGRRPKLEGEPHLEAGRMVVRFGLGECLEGCGGAIDRSAPRRRRSEVAFYCPSHADTSPERRKRHRDDTHYALEQAARFYGVA